MVSGLYLKGSASQMRMLSFTQCLSMFQVLLGSFASLPVHPGAPLFDTLKKLFIWLCQVLGASMWDLVP